jgi:hypothetical protein
MSLSRCRMSRRTIFKFCLASALAALLLLVPGTATRHASAEPPHKHLLSLSLPDLHVAEKERVVGFHFEVTSGRIAHMRDMPIGWNISVDNDPSWNTTIDASIVVAAAALDPAFFKEFAVIEKSETAGSPLQVEGDVTVSSDFSSSRKIRVEMKNFTIQEEVPPSKNHPSK